MDWLNQYAWIGALLFARLGSVMMIAPAWGEQTTPPMMRLGVAVLITATLAPSLVSRAPPMPADVVSAFPMIITEIIDRLLSLQKTIIISSHIFSTLKETCDQIHVLDQGQITRSVGVDAFDALESEMKNFTVQDKVNRLELR